MKPVAKEPLSESLFHRLDKNHDKVLDESELKTPEAAPYLEELKAADRNGDNRISLEEFRRIGEVSWYRDPKSAAALLLICGFACFCLFVDGLFEPERRDYFFLSIAGCMLLAGLSFLVARSWFLEDKPYLGYVAVVPAVLFVIAMLAGATKERPEPEAAATGPVVYKVGEKPAGGAAAGQKTAQSPRKPAAPVRTPRPAPLPRPPVPERPAQSTPAAQPPRPQPPRAQPPRAQPPRPPGPSSSPPGSPKPPPGKS